MYFSELIDSFDIFAISEHCLFVEQLEVLEASTNYKYNCIAVSSEDNPSILSGKPAHSGVALFWKTCFNDLVKPLEILIQIASLEFVVILMKSPLFIFNVYMPASSHCIEEFNEYLDYLWALYDSLSTEGFVIIMGDLSGDLENSLGDKGCYAPNDRGLRLTLQIVLICVP